MTDIGDKSASAAENPEPSHDEQAEIDRLRAEVEQLRSKQASTVRRRRIGWRAPVATILIVLGCVLAPVAVLGVWSANQVSDTSRYIANIEPLIHDPAVQNALTDKVTNEITSHLNVTGLTNQAAALLTDKGLNRVGTLLQSFGPSIASAVNGFIHDQVRKIVSSPQFANTWIQVNTVAHQAVVKVLSGEGNGTVTVSNGQVVIGLGPFINIVKQSLAARGFTVINSLPAINPTFPLFSARQLTKAQSAYRLINNLKIVLPILSLLLIGLGVYLARNHRRALIGAGLGFAASMLVLGAGLVIFRSIYLNSIPNSTLPSDAAAVLFDTFVRFIRAALRTLLVVGLVVAGAAFLTGPSTTATSIRKALKSGMELDPATWRARRCDHRAGRYVDLRAPQRPPYRGGGARGSALRVLGTAHGPRGHPDRGLAAGSPRPDRTDRQAARQTGDGRSAVITAPPVNRGGERKRLRPALMRRPQACDPSGHHPCRVIHRPVASA